MAVPVEQEVNVITRIYINVRRVALVCIFWCEWVCVASTGVISATCPYT